MRLFSACQAAASKETLRARNQPRWGIVEVTAIASMLVGGLAAALFTISCLRTLGSSWRAAEVTDGGFDLLALVSLVAGYQIKPPNGSHNQPFGQFAVGSISDNCAMSGANSRSGCACRHQLFLRPAGALT